MSPRGLRLFISSRITLVILIKMKKLYLTNGNKCSKLIVNRFP